MCDFFIIHFYMAIIILLCFLFTDTRRMPGTRTGSKLNIHNKLYYNVNQRKLRQEDKEWQKAEELRLKGAKGDGTPKIRYISLKGFRSPVTDAHTLPAKAANAMPGL